MWCLPVILSLSLPLLLPSSPSLSLPLPLIVHEHQRRHIVAAHRIVHNLVEDTPQNFAGLEPNKMADTGADVPEAAKNKEEDTLSGSVEETSQPKEEQGTSMNSEEQQAE